MQNILLKKLALIGSSAAVVTLMAGCAQLHQETAAEIVKGTPTTQKPRSDAPAKPASSTPVTTGKASTQAIALGTTPQARVVAGQTTHTVQAGETLYRVAVNNGLRYQDLAEWNNLDGYTIKVGQVLRLTPPDAPRTGATVTAPAASSTTSVVKPAETKPAAGQVPVEAKAPTSGADAQAASKAYPKALKLPYSEEAIKSLPAQSEGSGKPAVNVPPAKNTPDKPASKVEAATPVAPAVTPAEASSPKAASTGVVWAWPTQGNVVRGFSDQNKGIDIAGKAGQPVNAAADGKVVYSGSGLRGYGKLIILRHDKTFLSAYAHNSQLLVKEGQSVKKGQKIAEMGNTDADQVKLHFEIRQLGKPVDPSKFLETRP